MSGRLGSWWKRIAERIGPVSVTGRSGNDRPKVFGVGLSRTGTTSLTLALEELGFRILHYPTDPGMIDQLLSGRYRLSILEHHDGITDITTVPFFRGLAEAYPCSRFVLTLREKEGWLDSIRLLLSREPPDEDRYNFGPDPQLIGFRRFLREETYGVDGFDREAMSEAYDRHVASVREFFASEPHRLLEMDIMAGDGWEKLCPFLDLSCPERPFPHANRRPSSDPGGPRGAGHT